MLPSSLQVSGTSLESADIHDGDLIIVDPDMPPLDGEIYLVQIGTEVAAKWVYWEDDRLRLIGDNGSYEVLEERRVMNLEEVSS